MNANDKKIIQSRVLTQAKYDFTIDEKRIIYRIMEAAQNSLNGAHLHGKLDINLLGDAELTFGLSEFIPQGVERNNAEIKKALFTLNDKAIFLEDKDGSWCRFHYIEYPKFDKKTDKYHFTVYKPLWEAFLDFTKGYNTYFLKTAMSFGSSYSMRWYELLGNNTKPITYKIDRIKELFMITGKYKQYNDFQRRVIDLPLAEINEKSDVLITYSLITEKVGKGRPKVTGVTFTTTRKNTDEVDEIKKLTKNARGLVDNRVLEYLKNTYLFSDAELKRNTSTLRALCMEYGWGNAINKLAEIKEYARNKPNPKGYVINSIKNMLNSR